MCILLIYMAAMTSFQAHRRRTKATLDERLMKVKVHREKSFSKSLFLNSFLTASGAGPVVRKTTPSCCMGRAILRISALGPPVVNGSHRVLSIWVGFFECCRPYLER